MIFRFSYRFNFFQDAAMFCKKNKTNYCTRKHLAICIATWCRVAVLADFFYSFVLTAGNHGRQILFHCYKINKKRKLYLPIPFIETHLKKKKTHYVTHLTRIAPSNPSIPVLCRQFLCVAATLTFDRPQCHSLLHLSSGNDAKTNVNYP